MHRGQHAAKAEPLAGGQLGVRAGVRVARQAPLAGEVLASVQDLLDDPGGAERCHEGAIAVVAVAPGEPPRVTGLEDVLLAQQQVAGRVVDEADQLPAAVDEANLQSWALGVTVVLLREGPHRLVLETVVTAALPLPDDPVEADVADLGAVLGLEIGLAGRVGDANEVVLGQPRGLARTVGEAGWSGPSGSGRLRAS